MFNRRHANIKLLVAEYSIVQTTVYYHKLLFTTIFFNSVK